MRMRPVKVRCATCGWYGDRVPADEPPILGVCRRCGGMLERAQQRLKKQFAKARAEVEQLAADAEARR